MSSLDRWRRRTDVEVGIASGLAAGLLASLALGLFWWRSGYESLEAQREQCRNEIHSIDRSARPAAKAIAAVLEDQGNLVDISGPIGSYRSAGFPADARGDLDGALRWSFPILALRSDRWRVHESLPDGSRVVVSISLRWYQQETGGELGRQLLENVLAAWGGAVVVGAGLARFAMRPIRETTRALDLVSESRLDARLPLRGTNDPLDRHVEAINRMLARLEWAFGRLSAFSASAAHELRNPVNRMLNVVDVALLTANSEAERIAALQRVQEGAHQLQRLVEALMLLARGEEGRLPLERKPVNLRELLAKMLELYEPLASESRVALQLAGDPVQADVDAPLIERAIANLIDNALRHAPERSRILLSVRTHGGYAEIAVEDEGPGIPTSQRERVFDRFVRLDASTASPGIGLGLPIARMLARLHGGDVELGTGKRGGVRATLRLALHAPRS